jgi:cyclomaltodextrinase
VHEYKFLVDGERWYDDPQNQARVPDGFGGHNSVLRLGRLAQLQRSPAKVGDGEIDVLGLEHRPPLPLYVQALADDEVLVRYRTLADDVERVTLSVRGGADVPMAVVSTGPLFTYWEARVRVAADAAARTPAARSIEYTFLLDDGARRAADPHTYRYTFTAATRFSTPEWARDAVWYQAILDRFRNGDPGNDPDPVRPWTSEWFTPSPWEGQDGQTFYEFFVFDRFYGGDLAGLEAQLPYLRELGVNALYLNPIFKAPTPHKYDVQNWLHVDDHFGTKGDYAAVAAREDLLDPRTWQWTESDKQFLAFLKKAKSMGFRVVIDGVFNHVGDQHPAFLDVKERGAASRYADWFEVTSWEPLEYRGWADFSYMPVLRKSETGFASATLKEHLFAVTRRWMDPDGDGDPRDGIDGWRLDVPNEVPRGFWMEWRQLVKETNPDALITGEIWHRADQWLDGYHFDGVMNYPFAKIATAWLFDRERKITASDAAARLAELRLAYPAAATAVLQNLIDSHDTDRVASMAFNPDREYDRQNRVQDNNGDFNNAKPSPEAYARARLAALLQMTYVGAPLIYYGTEAGMWGADDPTNRKPMLWKDLEPYEQPDDNHVMTEQLDYFRRIIALRNGHSALRRGDLTTLLTDDAADVWAFRRSDEREHVLVILNASNEKRSVTVPLPADATTAGKWNVVHGSAALEQDEAGILSLSVPPVSGLVIAAPR